MEKYKVKVTGQFRVGYTLPAGISIIQMLHDAQALSLKIHKIVAVYPYRLSQWSRDKSFNKHYSNDTYVSVETVVEGSALKTRREQEQLLRSRRLARVATPFLAGAHAAFFIFSRKDIFDGYIIRCKNSKLYYGDGGLSEMDESDYINRCRYKNVRIAALRSRRKSSSKLRRPKSAGK